MQADFAINLDIEKNGRRIDDGIWQLVKNHHELEGDFFLYHSDWASQRNISIDCLDSIIVERCKDKAQNSWRGQSVLDKLFSAGLDIKYNRMLLDLLENKCDKYPRQVTVEFLNHLTVAMPSLVPVIFALVLYFFSSGDVMSQYLWGPSSNTSTTAGLLHLNSYNVPGVRSSWEQGRSVTKRASYASPIHGSVPDPVSQSHARCTRYTTLFIEAFLGGCK